MENETDEEKMGEELDEETVGEETEDEVDDGGDADRADDERNEKEHDEMDEEGSDGKDRDEADECVVRKTSAVYLHLLSRPDCLSMYMYDLFYFILFILFISAPRGMSRQPICNR